MSLALFDDDVAREFEPFALTRPACELRAGAELIRRRWEIALKLQCQGIVGAEHLTDFEEPGTPAVVTGRLERGTIVANSRCAVALAPASTDADIWRCGGRIAAVRLRESTDAEALAGLFSDESVGARAVVADIPGWWIDAVWDLVRYLAEMLLDDIPRMAAEGSAEVPASVARLGPHHISVASGASVDPYVILDATAGPILVRQRAVVQAFSRIVGPCVIGEDTTVSGGRIAASSIGEMCRVHGELSSTIFIGHANKSHDGFIGHSVLGRWVNLGASTVNSNLKNTYGPVSLWTPSGMRQTGMQFLGTFFGDHVKTAIGTRLTTGCVVGAGANLVGGTAEKVVPPFSWGFDGAEVFALDRFLVTAERMMARRHVTLGDRGRRQLAAAHARRWKVEE